MKEFRSETRRRNGNHASCREHDPVQRWTLPALANRYGVLRSCRLNAPERDIHQRGGE